MLTTETIFNSLRPEQTGCHFAFLTHFLEITDKVGMFISILLMFVQFSMNQHWLRQWLGAEQAQSHYLDQWWPRSRMPYGIVSRMPLDIMRPRWAHHQQQNVTKGPLSINIHIHKFTWWDYSNNSIWKFTTSTNTTPAFFIHNTTWKFEERLIWFALFTEQFH